MIAGKKMMLNPNFSERENLSFTNSKPNSVKKKIVTPFNHELNLMIIQWSKKFTSVGRIPVVKTFNSMILIRMQMLIGEFT